MARFLSEAAVLIEDMSPEEKNNEVSSKNPHNFSIISSYFARTLDL